MSYEREIVGIGPFTAGEKPAAIAVSFFEEDPPDMYEWAVGVTATKDGVEVDSWDGAAVWQDPELALAALSLGELTAGDDGPALWEVQLWAGDGTYLIASVVIRFMVHPSVGTPPDL
jgi:hypothetical protein